MKSHPYAPQLLDTSNNWRAFFMTKYTNHQKLEAVTRFQNSTESVNGIALTLLLLQLLYLLFLIPDGPFQ